MSRPDGKSAKRESKIIKKADGPISLKKLAAHLGLSPTTLSLVLNDSPLANTIPQETKNRILVAAREFNYRPNFIARSLRSARTFTLGVLAPEISGGYASEVLGGIEGHLLKEGYFYFVASHHHRQELLKRYTQLLLERCVEGLIAVDTPHLARPALPIVCVSGHDNASGGANIALDHERAAVLGLRHLIELGHRRIAAIKGQDFSSDTEVRWTAISEVAKRMEVPIGPELTSQLEGDSPSPETGYLATKKLLERRTPFTALFAFNDISAIGAIRALREAGLGVPDDVSVIGFDDIPAAAYNYPALTTIKQPLREMGRLAAEYLLKRITNVAQSEFPEEIMVEPELVIRQSTARARPL
ncbi:MAG: LacI family DNA-binding transcriptional regulator [Chloracidobacterium sp.]|nr:LacI family DNA-binding transcriptional regulator [Chloracidobacterium sp.]